MRTVVGIGTRARVLRVVAALVALQAVLVVGMPALQAEEIHPVDPYISWDNHLGRPAPGTFSFYSQPWRGYQETVPATQFLGGLGVNYNVPTGTDHDAAMSVLAASGFRAVRIEVPWSDVDWSADQLIESRRADLRAMLDAAKRHGMTPLVLLNANHGTPGPHQSGSRTVLRGGTKGSQTLVLDSTTGLSPWHSGLDNLTDWWMAENPFTSISGNVVTLAKPLPYDIPDGSRRDVSTLKYLPLHPVGTQQFEATTNGWLAYAKAVLDEVKASGFSTFDVEIWNELTFGSNFLSKDTWFGGGVPASSLHPGGPAYEMAARTVALARRSYPGVTPIWGYSNTAFHETAVGELPAGTGGQSYHPYGTAKAPYSPPPGLRPYFDYVPPDVMKSMPEGWAHLALANEQLPQTVLQPSVRLNNRPPGTTTFNHYFTEHGSNPRENGITDPAKAYDFKARSLIRTRASPRSSPTQPSTTTPPPTGCSRPPLTPPPTPASPRSS